MTKDSLYNWTAEQREEFEKEQEETNEKLRHYYMYEEFIEIESDAFSTKRKILMSMIEDGIEKGTISKEVRMMSRIKSNKSVYENKLKKKKLDDIFATTIVTKTQEELDYINEQLEKSEQIQIVRKKELNKELFVAKHLYLQFGKDENVIECRLQTIEHFEHSYSHTLYKANGDDELSEGQIAIIEENIQRMYDSGSASMYADIPLKWEAEFSKDKGIMLERQLTTNEVLKELYPFLKLKEEKQR